jgi:hypothetical protein
MDRQLAVSDRVTPADEHSLTPETDTAGFVERRVSKIDRRQTTLRSLLQGGLTPRRRAGRRAGDQQLIDWHDPYLLMLALVMLLLSVTDAFLTLALLSDGGQEMNPLLAFMLNEHPRLFAVVKMTLTGFGIAVLVAVAPRRVFRVMSVRLVFQLLVLAYLALVSYEWWLVSLMP